MTSSLWLFLAQEVRALNEGRIGPTQGIRRVLCLLQDGKTYYGCVIDQPPFQALPLCQDSLGMGVTAFFLCKPAPSALTLH